MPVRTLYFDESGFTGYNLLDPLQPIFAIASADIAEDKSLEVLQKSFPKYQGNEFKFSSIWSSNNRSGLLKFVAHLERLKGNYFVYMADKRFTVLCKIVDFLIEPFITDTGYDFYADGFCWKYANFIYYGFTQFTEPDFLNNILNEYQLFSRNPTLDNLATLQVQLRTFAEDSDERVKVFLEQMVLGAELFERCHDIEKFRVSNELQMTTMLAIVSYWRQRYREDFAVVHDDSSNFLRSRDMWEKITNTNVPTQSQRSGDGSDVEYPLRVVSTTPMNSKDSFSIQFCDVLAGLVTKHFSSRTEGEDRLFMDRLIDAGLKHVTYNGVRPELVFPDQIPPRRREGPDVVDQMMGIIYGSHNQDGVSSG